MSEPLLQLPAVLLVREPSDEYGGHEPPPFDLEPYTRAEIERDIRGGEIDSDLCEEVLTRASRERGGFDLAIGEGLAALRKGDRLAVLCFRLGDYPREVLGIAPRTAQLYARLATELQTRPLLREAVRAGRVRYRAACEVLPVARGAAEAAWVERASKETVRALRAAVKEVTAARAVEDEEWMSLRAQMEPRDREAVDEALGIAGRLMPGSGRAERLEAIAQEFLGAAASVADGPDELDGARLPSSFRPPRREEGPDDAAREQALEDENEHWAHLPAIPGVRAPSIDFDALTADEVDGKLRELARKRHAWDDHVGYAARTLRVGRVFQTLGFTSFRHYATERLGLSPRTVEQRADLEEELVQKPALREAKRGGLTYEKLRLLSRLPEAEIAAWAERARTMTCIALRRALGSDRERQLCARGRFVAGVPRSTAQLLAAAFEAVRRLTRMQLCEGKCLALMSRHFAAVWKAHVKRPRTPSAKARARDEHCQVPGCSRPADHAHHRKYRSHGGSDDLSNLVGTCAFHHQRCIHGGYLRPKRDAVGVIAWLRRGEPFTGGVV